MVTKLEIMEAATEIEGLLVPRECQNPERLNELVRKFGHIPAIDKILKDDYDRKAIHSGFGAPNCSCHIMPPCQACVDYTNEQDSQ